MLQALWKSQGHNANRQIVIIFNAMCDSRLHDPLGIILPWGHSLSTFYPRQPKRFYVGFIGILEVYILISHLNKSVTSTRDCSGQEVSEKYVGNNEVFMWKQFGVETFTLAMLKRKKKSWYTGIQILAPFPVLLSWIWNLSMDWYLIKIEESTGEKL